MTFPELVETIPTIEGPVSEPFGVFGAAIYLVRLVQRDPQDRVVEHTAATTSGMLLRPSE
jgi:hypothetical protein